MLMSHETRVFCHETDRTGRGPRRKKRSPLRQTLNHDTPDRKKTAPG